MELPTKSPSQKAAIKDAPRLLTITRAICATFTFKANYNRSVFNASSFFIYKNFLSVSIISFSFNSAISR